MKKNQQFSSCPMSLPMSLLLSVSERQQNFVKLLFRRCSFVHTYATIGIGKKVGGGVFQGTSLIKQVNISRYRWIIFDKATFIQLQKTSNSIEFVLQRGDHHVNLL